ncbi:hypothetical protein EB118_15025 [bacterium]|nr:hypothetical protein [bacterium]
MFVPYLRWVGFARGSGKDDQDGVLADRARLAHPLDRGRVGHAGGPDGGVGAVQLERPGAAATG